jgi:hypothetical protein
MRYGPLVVLCTFLCAARAFAAPAVEQEGPLSPCVPSQDEASGSSSTGQQAQAWGVEIAASFSKEEALNDFESAKKDYPEILGSYEPVMVVACDLHMGTSLRYSARIGMDSREDAEGLCAKLKAAGGACIVRKN